jgi:cytoskeletal protein CcmA (bactofilin family)
MSTHELSEAIVSAGTTIRGRVTGEGDVRVYGTVEGEVALRGALAVGDGGAVRAESVEASDVVVEGELSGDVTAAGELTVYPSGVLRGRVRARTLRIHEGAQVSAEIDCEFDLPEELREEAR